MCKLSRIFHAYDVKPDSAASTTFNERYDQAVLINTLGARQMCRLAQQTGAGLYLQVSTAFVNGEREGRTSERPFEWNRSIAQENERHTKAAEWQLDASYCGGLIFKLRLPWNPSSPLMNNSCAPSV